MHRLIQTKGGGKLVELPSASNVAASTPDHLWNAQYPGVLPSLSGSQHESLRASQDTESDASSNEQMRLLQEKLEALGTEYSNMIVSQLDSQRAYFEARLAQQQSERVESAVHLRVCSERDELQAQCTTLENEAATMKETMLRSEAAAAKQESQLRQTLTALRDTKKQLDEEKSVSDGLLAQVRQLRDEQQQLQSQVAELTEQLRDVMFFVSAREKVEEHGDALGIAGGVVSVPDQPATRKPRRGRSRP